MKENEWRGAPGERAPLADGARAGCVYLCHIAT